jgi:hypothetical protein
MSLQNIKPAFPTFQDIDSQPLENGFIYVGTAGLDAVSNPITIYWDSALTTAATQPVRTKGGFAMNGNAPGLLYTAADDFSLQVSDKNNSSVYSALNEGSRTSSSVISYTATGTGAVSRTLSSKLGDQVSVKDFGATGDGVTDDSAFFQAALDAHKSIFIPIGNYVVKDLVLQGNHKIVGESMLNTVLLVTTNNSSAFSVGVGVALSHISISNLSCKSDGASGCKFWESSRSSYLSFSKFDHINTWGDLLMSYDGAFIFTEWQSCIDGNNGSAVTDHQGIVAVAESTGTPSNLCTVENCHFFSFTKPALELNFGYNWSLIGCDFELGTDAALELKGIYTMSIQSCWFENVATANAITINNSSAPAVQGTRGLKIDSCYCNLVNLTSRFVSVAGASTFSVTNNLFANVAVGTTIEGGLGPAAITQFRDNIVVSGDTDFLAGYVNHLDNGLLSSGEITTNFINSPQAANQNMLPIGPTGLLAASFTNISFTSITDVSSQIGLAVNATAFTVAGTNQSAYYQIPALLVTALQGKKMTLSYTAFCDTTAGGDQFGLVVWDSVTPSALNYTSGPGGGIVSNSSFITNGELNFTVGASASSLYIGVTINDGASGAVFNIESMKLNLGWIKPEFTGF